MFFRTAAEYIRLNDGTKMPVLGFGTYGLRGIECEKCVFKAIEAGHRLIDTVRMYDNERFAGNSIRHYDRKDLFITIKLYFSERKL